jgi:hypothetical protein
MNTYRHRYIDEEWYPVEKVMGPIDWRSTSSDVRYPYRAKLSQFYPVVDHARTWAQLRGRQQKPKISQTFILSFAYKSEGMSRRFVEAQQLCAKSGMKIYAEDIIFRGLPASMVIIAESDVDMDDAIIFGRSSQPLKDRTIPRTELVVVDQ